ncbi:hypothetical protein LGG24_004795 [Escherichia coli]|nr:hypothetical protein [Escherichia coli]
MRISNVEWLKKRIAFIRKLGEKTARQRQIIDLLDDEASLSETERRLLHVLATAEKNALQERDAAQKKAVQARISGQKNRRERNHKLFLAAGLMIDAGLVDTKTGELNFDSEKLLTALKRVRCDLETSV